MDSIKAYELGHNVDKRDKDYFNKAYKEFDHTKYIFLLDFDDGKVYRYDISVLGNEQNGWNPDNESCEAFLLGSGHAIQNCKWMVTTDYHINEKK
tara:strand:- start:1394 stop:1678 length:285 start_codon:yes stop_codon:yes gene_type:complete